MRGIVLTLGMACFAVLAAAICGGQTLPSTSPAASTQPVNLPAEIADALKREAAALGPTVTVAFTEHWEPPLNAREYAAISRARNVDRDVTFTHNEKVHLTWQSDGRYLVTLH